MTSEGFLEVRWHYYAVSRSCAVSDFFEHICLLKIVVVEKADGGTRMRVL